VAELNIEETLRIEMRLFSLAARRLMTIELKMCYKSDHCVLHEAVLTVLHGDHLRFSTHLGLCF